MTSTPKIDGSSAINHVHLRGILADAVVFRDLPSGDVLAVFRLTVARPPGERARVDSIECATARPRLHRMLERAVGGEEVEVEGRLHRRFWRSPHGPASRYTVEVDVLRRIRSGRRGAA